MEKELEHINIGLEKLSEISEYRTYLKTNRRVSPDEIKLINMSLKNIRRDLGLSTNYSLESYSDPKLALENIFKDIYDKVIEGIKAFFRKVRDFFRNLFGLNKVNKVEERVKNGIKLVRKAKAKGLPPNVNFGNVKIETSKDRHRILDVFSIDGKSVEQDHYLRVIDNCFKLVDVLTEVLDSSSVKKSLGNTISAIEEQIDLALKNKSPNQLLNYYNLLKEDRTLSPFEATRIVVKVGKTAGSDGVHTLDYLDGRSQIKLTCKTNVFSQDHCFVSSEIQRTPVEPLESCANKTIWIMDIDLLLDISEKFVNHIDKYAAFLEDKSKIDGILKDAQDYLIEGVTKIHSEQLKFDQNNDREIIETISGFTRELNKITGTIGDGLGLYTQAIRSLETISTAFCTTYLDLCGVESELEDLRG